jgi:hypothetical protein
MACGGAACGGAAFGGAACGVWVCGGAGVSGAGVPRCRREGVRGLDVQEVPGWMCSNPPNVIFNWPHQLRSCSKTTT